MAFIEPGPISYREMKGGTIELLRKSTIDAAHRGLVGQPVTIGHPDAARTEQDIKDWARQNSVGTIESVSYNSEDGWFYAEGTVTKPEAVRENAKPSVVFFTRGYGAPGKFHGIPYGRELLAVEFDHIGLVPNPRFEDANFRFNSLTLEPESSPMKNPIKWLVSKLTKQKNAEGVEADVRVNEEGEVPSSALVDLGNGVQVSLGELVTAHEARMNAAVETVTLAPDAEVNVGGKMVKLADIVAGEVTARLNAAETEAAKKKKEAEDAETARLNAAAGKEFFVKLAAAKTNAPEFKTPDATPVAQKEHARVQKLFGPPGQKA